MTKRQQIWLIAGAVASVIAIFCCAGVIAAVVWWGSDSPDEVVDDYLEAVQEDDFPAARELTCDGWRRFGDLAGPLAMWTDVIDWDIEDTETREKSALVTADVTYRVLGTADRARLVFTLVDEDGDWRVCGIRATR